MDDVMRSRSSSHVTDISYATSSVHVPSAPPLPQDDGMRTPDGGFAAVMNDINSLIRSESYRDESLGSGRVSPGRRGSTHVDGQYIEDLVTDGDSDIGNIHTSQAHLTMATTSASTSQHVQVNVITEEKLNNARISTVDDGNTIQIHNTVTQEPEELYAQVIRPTGSRVRISTAEPNIDWPDAPPEVPTYMAETYRFEGEQTQHVGGIITTVEQAIVHQDNSISGILNAPQSDIRKSGEWQEMALEVADDQDVANVYRAGSSTSRTHMGSYNIYQTPRDNTTATIITVDGQRHTAPMDQRAVNFTSDTRDNEGQSKRHLTEGYQGDVHYKYIQQDAISFRAQEEQWSSGPNTITGTWPQPVRQQQGEVAIIMGKDQYTTPFRPSPPSPTQPLPYYGNRNPFPGSATMPSTAAIIQTPFTQVQTFPRPSGIRITDTDTLHRTANNTSVINIDTSTDGRSVGNYSVGNYSVGPVPSLTGWNALHGTSTGSINKEGSSAHPTMLATTAAYVHSKHGANTRYANGIMKGPNGYTMTDADTAVLYLDDELPEKKDSSVKTKEKTKVTKCIALETRSKKCRVITSIVVFIVAFIIMAILLALFTN